MGPDVENVTTDTRFDGAASVLNVGLGGVPYIVPDHECKQGKCANATTGCVGVCQYDRIFGGVSITAVLAPDGWQLVPKEPTQEMQEAGNVPDRCMTTGPRSCYQAMLAAAPKPPNDQAKGPATAARSADGDGPA